MFNVGDQFVYPSDTYDYDWYGILTIQKIDEGWVTLVSSNTHYDAEYKFFDSRDLKFPLGELIGMVQKGKLLPYRQNPAKCNDGSFSASPHNSKGTCTWHEGVQGSATQAQYNKSKSRVRYRSPKGYKGSFAPPKGKTKSAPKPIPLEQTLDAGLKVFEDNQFIVKINDAHFITGVVQDEEQFLKALSGLLYVAGKKFDPNHYPLAYSTVQAEYNDLFKNKTVSVKDAEYALETLKKNLSTSKIGQSFQEYDWSKGNQLQTVYGYTWKKVKGTWYIQYSNNMLLEQPLSDEKLAKKTEIAIQQYENQIKLNQEFKIAQQMEKEQKAKENDLGGYEQTLTPLQLGKLKKTLGKLYNHDGKTTTLKDFIIEKLENGATVTSGNFSYTTWKGTVKPYTIKLEYGGVDNDEYAMMDAKGDYPKTAMKWALWMYENHYAN